MFEESEKNTGSCGGLPEGAEPGTRSAEIVEQFAMFGAAAFLLATALEADDEESARDLFEFADFLGFSFSDSPVFDSRTYNALSYATGCEIAAIFHKNEFYYQDLFRKFSSIVVPDCELITRKQSQPHQPDAWVSVNGDDVPVEVKLGAFDRNAMKQLKRYMSVYECECGVAVGRTSDIEPWPDNVFWVSLDTLDELEKQSIEYRQHTVKRAERKKRNLEAVNALLKEMLPPDATARRPLQ